MFEFVEDGLEFASGIGCDTVQFASVNELTLARTKTLFIDKHKKGGTGSCSPYLVNLLQATFSVEIHAEVYDETNTLQNE